MSRYNLVYFPIRGRGEAIRLLLEDNGLDYEETDTSWENFVKKWKPMTPFGQLPAIYDGDFFLVQSCAILRYLAHKHDLYGSSNMSKARIDELNDGVEDLRSAYVKMIYVLENYETGRAQYIEKLPNHLQAFEKILSANKAGETGAAVKGQISFVDYNLFDLLDIHLVLVPTCLDSLPVLKAYHGKIAAHPKISAYRQSKGFKERNINGNGKQ